MAEVALSEDFVARVDQKDMEVYLECDACSLASVFVDHWTIDQKLYVPVVQRVNF